MMIRLTSPPPPPSGPSSRQNHHHQHQPPPPPNNDSNPYNDKTKLVSGRRRITAAVCATVVTTLATHDTDNSSGRWSSSSAVGLDFEQMLKMSGPSAPTLDDAVSGIRDHAQSLLEVKDLLSSLQQEEGDADGGSWREAQKMLRRSSSNLKIDMSSIIQSKPPALRPRLRALYSNLFNTVTKLDYAARERDVKLVWELYEKMAVALQEVLSAI